MPSLVASNQASFSISSEAAMLSEVLKAFIQEVDDQDEEMVFPFPNISEDTMSSMVKFMTEHTVNPMREIPKPIPWPKRISDVVAPFFFAEFVMSMTLAQTMDVLVASDFLDIPPLLELCCARLSRLMINKTPEQLIELFQVTDEVFSEEEYNILLNDCRWSTLSVGMGEDEAEPKSPTDSTEEVHTMSQLEL